MEQTWALGEERGAEGPAGRAVQEETGTESRLSVSLLLYLTLVTRSCLQVKGGHQAAQMPGLRGSLHQGPYSINSSSNRCSSSTYSPGARRR